MLQWWLMVFATFVDCKTSSWPCSSPIYCNGTILAAVQQAPLFEDSKRFVDMPSKYSEAKVIERFNDLPDHSSKTLRQFVEDNFHAPGHELSIVLPQDWPSKVPFFQKIRDQKLQSFAQTVHRKWRGLVRQVNMDRVCDGCASSVVALPHPFIVPGGRFRELYYWDSFWILEGLYASAMCQTASNMLKNFQWLIDTFGFIPNGSRSYYLNRSHPPLYPIMLQRHLEECVSVDKQQEWLKQVLPSAEKEYQFWMNHRTIEVPLYQPRGNNTGKVIFNRYRADTTLPRPESFLEDVLLGKEITKRTGDEPAKLYREISTAAETGLDFTGRWFRDGKGNLTDMHTSDLVPVDLNAILAHNERTLAELFDKMGDGKKGERFHQAAKVRHDAIEQVLWDKRRMAWIDFDLQNGKLVGQDMPFYLSSLSPLWHEAHNFTTDQVIKILEYHDKILSLYGGGIPFDETITGQQWDFPNIWAPFQYYLVLVYERLAEQMGGQGEGKRWHDKAVDVAQRFINSTYCGFVNFGQFFEKYNAKSIGLPGGGGEYVVQEGFGWTNGVTLWLLKRYPEELYAPICVDLNPTIVIPEPSNSLREEEFVAASDFLKGQTLTSLSMLLLIAILVLAINRAFNKGNDGARTI